jgi:hypothetical protein
LALCRLAGAPTFFDALRESKLFASFALSLFNLTRLWAGFAECFDQSFYVDAFPERLLTDYMLVSMMLTA